MKPKKKPLYREKKKFEEMSFDEMEKEKKKK